MTESFVLPAPLVVCGPRWKAKRVAGARKKSIVSRRVVAENNVSDLIASHPRASSASGSNACKKQTDVERGGREDMTASASRNGRAPSILAFGEIAGLTRIRRDSASHAGTFRH